MAVRMVLRWLSVRHSLRTEAVAVLLLYALYETSRGLVAGHRSDASHHAREIVAVERPLHLFVERDVQHAV
jgi:hypothetical protein